MRALFFSSSGPEHNDNHIRIPEAFRTAGWDVTQTPHDSLCWRDGHLSSERNQLTDFDLIWPIGFGPAATYLDRLQMLRTLPDSLYINAPAQQANLHSKAAWLDFAPRSLIACTAQDMREFMTSHGGEWVLKPLAGSFGQEVFRLAEPGRLEEYVQGDRYWLLQRFIPEIHQGETRTLIANGSIIGSYLRSPAADEGEDRVEFRTNLALQGEANPTTLSAEDSKLVESVKRRLAEQHIGFAAVDTCGGYVVEVNVANPGGLATLAAVYERDFDQALVTAVAQRFTAPN